MKHFSATILLALLGVFAACTQKQPEAPTQSVSNAQAQAKAFYAAHPDFFDLSTAEALPTDLDWRDGQDQPIFANPSAQKGGTFRDFIMDFPRTLRVVGPDANGSFRGIILDENALSLLGQHPNTGEFYGVLAKQWAASPDKTTVYFRLDPDARFSDGEKVTADNYLFAFYFFRSSHISDPWYNNFYATEYKRITRYDDYTIAITLPEAKANYLEKAGGLRPLPMEFYSELGADYPVRYQWRFEPTTGPYELKAADVKKGRSITMRRIKDWWAAEKKFFQGRYNPDAMEYTVIRDTGKAYELFLAGELDYFGLGLPEYWYDRSENASQVKNGYIKRATFYNIVPRPTYGFYLNTSDPLLSILDVRQGLAKALNWDRVISFFFRGDYERMRTYAEGYGRYTHPSLQPYPFDPATAAALFAKAGFTQRGSDGILLNPTTKERLSISITAADGPLNGVLMILKEEAIKAGVELNLDILEGTTAFKKISEKKHQGCFMAFNVSVERYPRYWEMFHSVNAKPQSNNLCNLADPTIDALIERYDREINEDEIEKISHKLQELIHQNACYLPAFMKPWYRVGYWRYIRYPEGFDVKVSRTPTEGGLFWIDAQAKAETLAAMREGRTFEPQTEIFDQWKHSSK